MSEYTFPPTSTDLELISQLAQVYKTLVPGKDAIYISTPMTSGKLYITAWAELRKHDSKAVLSPEKKQILLSANCKHAQSVATITRLLFPTATVIDPTQIKIEGWEQDDYLTFWRKVILEYTEVLKFVNDWYYSNGCAYEYLLGVMANKVTLDERGNDIFPHQGRDLILSAYNIHLQNGYDNQFLFKIVQSLNKHLSNEDGA